MAIGNTNGASADIGQGGVHCPQSRCGQEEVTKIGKESMYLKGDMVSGG